MSDADKQAVKRIKANSKGFFRTFRTALTETASYGVSAIDGLIFEQKRSLIRDRTVGDAEFLRDLRDDAEEFGGINACKQAHNELVALMEELKL